MHFKLGFVSDENVGRFAKAVKADFDFREYMERLKVNRKLERWKDILKPAPFKIRRRPEK